MHFVQTISFTTSRIDELQKMADEYEQDQDEDRAETFAVVVSQ